MLVLLQGAVPLMNPFYSCEGYAGSDRGREIRDGKREIGGCEPKKEV